MHWLFVCSLGHCRSAIAARAYNCADVSTRHAGVAPDASIPLREDDLRWAERVFVFEDEHRAIVEERLRAIGADARCTCLPINEVFRPSCPELRRVIAQNPRPALALSTAA